MKKVLLLFIVSCTSMPFSEILDKEIIVPNSGYVIASFGSSEVGMINATCSVLNHPNYREYFERSVNITRPVSRVRVKLNRTNSLGLFSDFCIGVKSSDGLRWTTTIQLVDSSNGTSTYQAIFNQPDVESVIVFFEREAVVQSFQVS